MSEVYDVVIVGAGPGGSATAHYLAKQGKRVLLLDKSDFPRDKTCGDGLTPRALDVLQDMGILNDVNKVGYQITGIDLHGRKGNMMTAVVPKHPIYPDHMVIAPRLRLDDIIRQRAVKSGAEFHSPVRVRDIVDQGDKVLVKGMLNNKQVSYTAQLVVLAVGASTKLIRDLGILTYDPKPILAARGYYEGVSGLDDHVQAHFEEVPLPGYGWVFPISKTAANIGIGFWESLIPWKKPPSSARVAMEHWLAHSKKMRAMMNGAQLVGAIKGYPLRTDFATAPTYKGRIMLVGETAGLVSPLTGEGIDFALESGKIAAGFLEETFERGEFSGEAFKRYDQILRDHFQHLFVFLGVIRQLYVNPLLMEKAIQATRTFPDIKEMLVKIMMGQEDAASMVNLTTFRKVLFGI